MLSKKKSSPRGGRAGAFSAPAASRLLPFATRAAAHAAYGDLCRAARVYAEAGEPLVMAALLAYLGRRDLFFLLVYLLNRPDADNDWCFVRCAEVSAAPDGYLDLWAREHFKSSIITFALTIQDILRDPEITAGIFSHSRPVAKGFLRQIKREFEDNELLKTCFPDVLYASPAKEAPQWSEEAGIIVRRKTNPKEATVEAWGLVDGAPTGKHFSLLVYDDVVTRESVATPEMIKKTTDAWALSLNLGARPQKGRKAARRHIGTRYHFADTYQAILDRGAAQARIHPATIDGKEEGRPVLLSPEELIEKRRSMGPYIFGCQMLQNPKADTVMGFKQEWLRSYTLGRHPAESNFYLLCDPAGAKKTGSDYSVFWVLALGCDGNIYLVDGVRDRLNLTERAQALFRLHRKWRPLAVGYERYGMQADIEHIRYVQNQEGYRFSIIELGGAMPKNDRIRRLVPVFEQGRFYLPETLPYRDLTGALRDLAGEFTDEEYLAFPVCGHDDMLDCASRVLDAAFPARFPRRAGTGVEGKPVMCLTGYAPGQAPWEQGAWASPGARDGGTLPWGGGL